MNYSVYNQQGKLIAVNSAKNRQEMRSKVMASKYRQETHSVQYGRTVYTAAQIYGTI